jgi:hypothetical protein
MPYRGWLRKVAHYQGQGVGTRRTLVGIIGKMANRCGSRPLQVPLHPERHPSIWSDLRPAA